MIDLRMIDELTLRDGRKSLSFDGAEMPWQASPQIAAYRRFERMKLATGKGRNSAKNRKMINAMLPAPN